MPTTITHIIDPDNGAGTDYTSIAAWQTAQKRDLTAVDEIAVALLRCTGGTALDFPNIVGWTTDATRYIKIVSDEAYRAPMKRGVTGNCVRIVSDTVYTEEDYVWLDGLHINSAYDTFSFSSGGVFKVSNCYKQLTAALTNAFSGDNGVTKIWNCIADGPAASIGFRNIAYVYNCTASGFGRGFTGFAGSVMKNCLSCNNSIEDFASGTPTYCSSEDGTASGTGSRASQTFTFVDESGGDFHLASTDAGAIGFGTDLSADANLAFSDDIDGDARGTTWDIGADQFVAGGGTNTVTIRARVVAQTSKSGTASYGSTEV